MRQSDFYEILPAEPESVPPESTPPHRVFEILWTKCLECVGNNMHIVMISFKK